MTNFKSESRRIFLRQASVLGAATVFGTTVANGFNLKLEAVGGDHYTFLFQGDSITDGNRGRNLDWNHVLGHGYAYLIASRLWYRYTQKDFHFFNRGVSGNTVLDLTQRWQEDTIALKPNLLSILIGVNDTTRAVESKQGFTAEIYEDSYRALLKQTKEAVPGIEFVILEPFILPVGKVKDKWEEYSREVSLRQSIAKRLAEEFNAVFVPLQEAFNKAAKEPSPIYWIWDGIHPMPNGHELIAREWLKHVSKKLKFVKI